jgi:anti-anti-sigma regulatory factor
LAEGATASGELMNDPEYLSRVTINFVRGCLVATIQHDLDRFVLERFRRDLLGRLEASGSRQVIMDCSGIEVLDAEDFAALRRVIAMASLMGARTVLASLQPGVVSALVDLDADLDGLQTALSLDDAFELLERAAAATEGKPVDEADEDAEGASPA